jgi:uncharacterized glyoxalase superfamily protein PhnB
LLAVAVVWDAPGRDDCLEEKTMSITGSTIIPSTRYKDAPGAIEWLCRVFGFAKHAVYEGPNGTIAHAELTLGGGLFMLGSESNGHEAYTRTMVSLEETGGRETVALCLIVEDCDAVYARAMEAGAAIVDPLREPGHGGKSFACRDVEGHVWWVGSYNPWEVKQ